MKLKAISGIILMLLLVCMLALACDIQLVRAAPATIIVPDDYSTIQEAINAASENDTIFVRSGTYPANIIINKTVSLVGENPTTTIIEGGGPGIAVNLTASNTALENFTIRSRLIDIGIYSRNHSTVEIKNNIITNNGWGVWLKNLSNSIITGNEIANNTVGTQLLQCSNNTLSGNIVNSNRWDGITCQESSGNILTNNTIIGNNDNGIHLVASSRNKIINNTVNSNDWGIRAVFSHANNISDNTVNSNTHNGIYLDSSSNNILMGNLAEENNNYDVFVWGDTDDHYNNIIENNIGSGYRPIKYLNYSANLQHETLSELILCNADKSNINRVRITGSETLRNNGVLVLSTEKSNITNVDSSKNRIGIYLRGSSGNTLSNNTLISNDRGGICLDGSSFENPGYDVGAGEPRGSGGTYYVSPTGNDTNSGLTEDQPWRTIEYAATQAMAGDTVYIKGGHYGNECVVIENSGTRGSPIVFQGYEDVPGDVPEPDAMPFLNGSERYQNRYGIVVAGKKYITIKNVRIDLYRAAVRVYESQYVTLDSIFGSLFGQYGTIVSDSRYINIRNSSMTDASAANFLISRSHYNVMENCRSYGVTVDDATDYYIVIYNSHDNVVRNCLSQNQHPEASVHHGHGIGLKDLFDSTKKEYVTMNSYNNKIINCKTIDNGEPFFVAHRAHHNEFLNATSEFTMADFTDFHIRDGAHNNKFIDCKGNLAAIEDTAEGPGRTQIKRDNTFVNCVFHGAICSIFLQYAENNTFKNCVFTDATFLFYFLYENNDNKITNSIVTSITHHNYTYETDPPSGGNPVIACTDFYDNGFDVPNGTGNLEVDPLFVNATRGDYHLKSEYGRWNGSTWVYDNQTSPCIDTGDPVYEYRKEPQPNGGRINMGAYGGTSEASKSSISGEIGDFVHSPSNNIVRNSRIENNLLYGIHLSDAGEGGPNLIYHNLFNNTVNVVANVANSLNTNFWDDGYPSGGNFWSDYADIDNHSGSHQNVTGSDGVWDNPYIMDANNQDNYPLVNPWTELPGDIDGDRDVDYDDFIVLAGVYGISLGEPNYHARADLDNDDDIDYDDFVVLAGNYGKTI